MQMRACEYRVCDAWLVYAYVSEYVTFFQIQHLQFSVLIMCVRACVYAEYVCACVCVWVCHLLPNTASSSVYWVCVCVRACVLSMCVRVRVCEYVTFFQIQHLQLSVLSERLIEQIRSLKHNR